MYTRPPSHIARMGHRVAQSFFMSDNFRQELLQRQTACLTFPVSEDDCPSEVDNYHSLCPLEPVDKTPPDQVREGEGRKARGEMRAGEGRKGMEGDMPCRVGGGRKEREREREEGRSERERDYHHLLHRSRTERLSTPQPATVP